EIGVEAAGGENVVDRFSRYPRGLDPGGPAEEEPAGDLCESFVAVEKQRFESQAGDQDARVPAVAAAPDLDTTPVHDAHPAQNLDRDAVFAVLGEDLVRVCVERTTLRPVEQLRDSRRQVGRNLDARPFLRFARRTQVLRRLFLSRQLARPAFVVRGRGRLLL